MSEGNPNIVKISFDEIEPTPFSPDYILENAVTRMVASYNAIAEAKGKPQIMPGQTLRVRVFYHDQSKKPKDGFSTLDRLVFDGVAASTSFKGVAEVKRVGDFARLRQNPDGTYAEKGPVYLQIATYSDLQAVVKRNTEHFKAEGIAKDAPASFEGWLQ